MKNNNVSRYDVFGGDLGLLSIAQHGGFDLNDRKKLLDGIGCASLLPKSEQTANNYDLSE